jgi:uncharacterized membrane protein HdeD (DUF308 family)
MATTTVDQEERRSWWVVLVEGLALLILGFLLLIRTEKTLELLMLLLGLFWLVSGVVALIRLLQSRAQWGLKLATGILGILAGLLVLQLPLGAAVIIPATLAVILGIVGMAVGVILIVEAIQGKGWGLAILGVASIILGFLLVFNPVAGAVAVTFAAGILAIVGGLAAIIVGFRMRS